MGIVELAESFEICSCCGCEYGYDDNAAYRNRWLQQGTPWFSPKEQPKNWNLETQLQNINPKWDELKQKARQQKI